MRPKTYFLRPDVAIPLGFALLREIWNQKVGGWLGARAARSWRAGSIRIPGSWAGLRGGRAHVCSSQPGQRRQWWRPGCALSCPSACPCGSLRQLPASLTCRAILLQVVGRPDAYVMPAATAKR